MTTWTKPPQIADQWVVLSGDNIRRFTQDGRLRITEQGGVRILERRDVSWTTEPTISNPWS